jgi:transcriptional repressor NrdR
VGRAILGPLRELDEVAYLRFASVYCSFESLDDFEDEIRRLRAAHAAPTQEPTRSTNRTTGSDPVGPALAAVVVT